MKNDSWQRQIPGKPLYPDILWSRPENKRYAGKLLIIGGNVHGFSAPAEAYQEALASGIGSVRVLLPDSLQKTVGRAFAAGEYAPSTPSGSFGTRTIAELLALAQWADGVVCAGDFGRNSETAIVIEQALDKYSGQLTLTKDALDYALALPLSLLERPDTCLVMSFAQLQKLTMKAHFPTAVTFGMDLLHLVEALQNFSAVHSFHIITKHHDSLFMASGGRVSTTKLISDEATWRVRTASHAATWWLQTPTKPYEAMTMSIYDLFLRSASEK